MRTKVFSLIVVVLIASAMFMIVAYNNSIHIVEDYSKAVAQEPAREREYKTKYWTPGLLEIVRIDNLHSESFPEGFRIEVKNISHKSIYNIWIEVLLPDAKQYLGGFAGSFPLKYGNPSLHPAGSIAQPTDEKLDPGESVVIKPHASVINNFFTSSKHRDQIRKYGTWRIILDLQKVNFGDGTGYQAGQSYPAQKIGFSKFSSSLFGHYAFFNGFNANEFLFDSLLNKVDSLQSCPYSNCGRYDTAELDDCGYGPCFYEQLNAGGFPNLDCSIPCTTMTYCLCYTTRLDPCSEDPPLCCCDW